MEGVCAMDEWREKQTVVMVERVLPAFMLNITIMKSTCMKTDLHAVQSAYPCTSIIHLGPGFQ